MTCSKLYIVLVAFLIIADLKGLDVSWFSSTSYTDLLIATGVISICTRLDKIKGA